MKLNKHLPELNKVIDSLSQGWGVATKEWGYFFLALELGLLFTSVALLSALPIIAVIPLNSTALLVLAIIFSVSISILLLILFSGFVQYSILNSLLTRSPPSLQASIGACISNLWFLMGTVLSGILLTILLSTLMLTLYGIVFLVDLFIPFISLAKLFTWFVSVPSYSMVGIFVTIMLITYLKKPSIDFGRVVRKSYTIVRKNLWVVYFFAFAESIMFQSLVYFGGLPALFIAPLIGLFIQVWNTISINQLYTKMRGM